MIYDITDYGARPDAPELQTDIIQDVINRCYLGGGGEIIVPGGRYRTGGILLRSNVTFHLLENAVLEGSSVPGDYLYYQNDPISPEGGYSPILSEIPGSPESKARIIMTTSRSYWNYALIRAIDSVNVSIIGEKGSKLDGVNCFDPNGENNYRGPHGINMFCCRGVTLKGYTVVNCGNWAHAMFFCDNIVADGISVRGGHDGFHVRSCTNIILENADLRCGDDAVAGFDNVNMTVAGCYLNSACNAMRFGGTNVIVRDCVVEGPGEYVFRGSLKRETQENSLMTDETGRYDTLSFFDYFGDESFDIREQPGNIIIRDCTVRNVDRFIHYNYSGSDPWQSNRPLSGIVLKDVAAEDIGSPVIIYGDKGIPINARFENVRIGFDKNVDPGDFMRLCNYSRIILRNTSVGFLGGFARPIITRYPGVGEEIVADGDAQDDFVIVDTDKEFMCIRF